MHFHDFTAFSLDSNPYASAGHYQEITPSSKKDFDFLLILVFRCFFATQTFHLNPFAHHVSSYAFQYSGNFMQPRCLE